MGNDTPPVQIDCYSDVLCIWAYGAQARLDALRREFGDAVEVHHHFLCIFGNTEEKVDRAWQKEGGAAGYSAHVRNVAQRFPGLEVHPDVWTRNAPATCLSAHLALKALQILQQTGKIDDAATASPDGRPLVEEAAWRLRLAFFRDLRDIGRLDEVEAVLGELGVPIPLLREVMYGGQALAALSRDVDARQDLRIEGSPTYLLNEGRQKLYGNVAYEVLAANVRSLIAGA